MSDRNSRRWINDTLVSLPAKVKNKSLVGRLRQFSLNATKVKGTVGKVIEDAKQLQIVFPETGTAVISPKLIEIRKKAKAATRDLSGGVEAVGKPIFEKKMIEMLETANGASKPLLELWQRRIDEAITPFMRISRAVAELQLDGSASLQGHIKAIQVAQTSIPDSEAKAQLIKQSLDSLPTIIGGLGLKGKTGEFLIAVAERNGSARDLDNLEIRAFLDRYQLWDALKVSLGDSK